VSTRLSFALAALAAAALLGWRAHTTEHDLATARDLHGAAYAGSDACRRCHEEHHASWHRTYHRTMTREATPETVLGDFDGRTLEYFGWRAEMRRDHEGYALRFTSPAGHTETARIHRAVGSHRYQQYLTKRGDTYLRLPVAWSVREQRFFHMNGAFLTPDPQHPAPARDFHRHVARWNDNCVFCHNVAPNPGRNDEGFDTEVAELGVACEACHGPGAEHAARNADPVRRYALHLSDADDPSIVSPADLSPERSAEICGRCHGQRLTDDIGAFLEDGDPFVPGDDLARYSEPLWADTTLNGEPVFGPRFWADGSPRLTAYEYQGWLLTRCGGGELTCTTCHGMHEGDPAGQLRPSHEGDDGCLGCHDDDGHDAHEQTLCVDCHMPRVVYGLVDAHRTHRIEVPDPEDHRRPDACTLCHVDRAAGMRTEGVPEVTRMLLGGDPIERALAAAALGRAPVFENRRPPSDREARNEVREPHDASLARAGLLLDVLRDDPYPAVRRVAARALRQLGHDTGAYVPESRAELRGRAVADLDIPHLPPPADLVRRLRAEAGAHAIEIGE